MSMAKGMNKQALLRQKMEEARRRSSDDNSQNGEGGSTPQLSEEEIQEQNDRLRFAQLLKQGSTTSASYVNFAEEEDLIAASGEYLLNMEPGNPQSSHGFPFSCQSIGRTDSSTAIELLLNHSKTLFL
jgi:hypothetical protein